MKRTEFYEWLVENGLSPKVAADCCSRATRVERALRISLDEEFERGNSEAIIHAFDKKGQNNIMESFNPIGLPIGTYPLSAIKLAVKRYYSFLKNEFYLR